MIVVLWRPEMSDFKKKDDTSKTSLVKGKKSKLLYTFIFLAIIVLVIFFILVSIDPGTRGSSSSKINQMKRLAAKIGKLEVEVQEKQNELLGLLKIYSQKTGKPLPIPNGLGLSDEEKKILKDKIINEKDVSLKSLLSDILEKDGEISELNDKMKDREALLPTPYVASEGESHYEIAMKFLTNERGINKEKALRLVERTALFGEPLVAGFRVWNFYSGDEFATFVTMGSADISPNRLRRIAKQYLLNARDRALAEKERLAVEINELKSTKNQLVSQVSGLRYEKQELTKRLDALFKESSEMRRALYSLFFMVDLEKNLIKKGIMKSKFLGLGSPKLKEMSPEDFKQAIDLRKTDFIEIYASQFNLSKIKKITLYPKFYKKDVDYEVINVKNKKRAIVKIMDIKKFKGERVVISVE